MFSEMAMFYVDLVEYQKADSEEENILKSPPTGEDAPRSTSNQQVNV